MSGHDIERRILSLAALVSADEAEARHWYRSDPIAGLDGRTADELVLLGHGAVVVDFLLDVLRHETQAGTMTGPMADSRTGMSPPADR